VDFLTRINFQTNFYIHKSFLDTHGDNSPLFVSAENFKDVMPFPNTVFPLIPIGHKNYWNNVYSCSH
jgi:hypothetical protein